MILIRLATEHDLIELQEVAITTYRDTFASFNTKENMEAYLEQAYSISALKNELSEPGSLTMVATDGERIIGFMRLRQSDEVKEILGDNTLELQRLYVLTEAHGKKAGSRLMEQALQYAEQHNYEWIWLGVWERNFNAQAFYAKWGFEKFSEHTFWMGDDPQTDWLLKKKL